MRRFVPIVALLVSWPCVAYPQEAGDDYAAASERFGGEWRLVGSRAAANRRVENAANEAANAMSFFVRAIARSRLREGSPVNERITLEFLGDRSIRVQFSAGGTYETPLAQTRRRRRPDGEVLRVTQRLRPSGELEQVFQGEQGTRWFVYRATAPDRIRLEITTDSERMPQPMHYTLDYRR